MIDTDAIELICEKLGTTMENLIPAVIKYITHQADIIITFGLTGLILGTILIAAGIYFAKKCDSDGIGFFFIGALLVVVGAFLFIGGCYDKHMISVMPTISAYKEILGWLNP